MTSAIERAVAAVGPDRFLASLSTQEQQALAYQWRLWARPSQLPPADILAHDEGRPRMPGL